MSGILLKHFCYFVVAATLSIACSTANTTRPATNLREPQGSVLTVEDSALTQAALQYLALPKEAPMAEYAQKRAEFEVALAHYLSGKHAQFPRTLKLKRDGLTLVFPLQLLQTSPGVSSSSDGKPAAHFPVVAPSLQGDILDLALVPKSGSSSRELFILFADSLLVMKWPGSSQTKLERLWFHPMDMSEKRPARGRGVLAQMDGSPGTHPTLITTSLKSALVLGRDKHSWRTLRPYRTDIVPPSLLNWRRSTDGSSFQIGDTDAFLSLRSMANNDYQVLVDEDGFLKLYRDNLQTRVWQSQRAWGSNLFLLENKILAVCDDNSQRFVLLQLDGNSLVTAGTSPIIPGRVTAVARARMEKVKGFVVASQTRHSSASTLRFIAQEDFQLHGSDTFPPAQIRDLEATFALAVRAIGSDILGIPKTVRPLIYETLYRQSTGDSLIPILAANVSSDAAARTWEVELRPDIRFTDGSPVTAPDVIQSWQRNWLQCQQNHCTSKWLWQDIMGAEEFVRGQSPDIAGLTAKGPTRLIVTLTKTRPQFVQHLTQTCFEVTKISGAGVFGTGPFVVRKNAGATFLERNASYHAGAAPLHKIELRTDIDNPIDFLSTGGLKGALVQRKQDVDYVDKLDSFEMATFPRQTLYYLAINPDVQPLEDRSLRQRILASVLRRDVIASIITESQAQVSTAFFGHAQFEVQKASGDKPGTVEHTLLVSFKRRDAVAAQIARRLVARLNQFGLNSRAQRLTDTAFATLLQSRRYDILVDAIESEFAIPLYNFAQLVNRGYTVPVDVRQRLQRALAEPTPPSPDEMERELIRAAILYPVIRTQKYAAFPKALLDWRLVGSEIVDLARAWSSKQSK